MWRLAMILSTMAIGCGSRAPTSYAVHVSSAFSADESASVLEGIGEWSAMIPELSVRISNDPCDRGMVCIERGRLESGDELAHTTVDMDRVTIDADKIAALGIGDQLSRIAAHEMGHAMGLIHTGPGTIMCAHPQCEAAYVTPEDVAQWSLYR